MIKPKRKCSLQLLKVAKSVVDAVYGELTVPVRLCNKEPYKAEEPGDRTAWRESHSKIKRMTDRRISRKTILEF